MRETRGAFEDTFELKLGKPDEKHAFDGSSRPRTQRSRPRYFFEEWNVAEGQLNKIVFWPNHPRWPPVSTFKDWKTACEEFKNRNGKLVDRIGAA